MTCFCGSDLDQFALGFQPAANAGIVEGMRAHQDLGGGLDIVLVEQPDFQRGDLLRLANADGLGDAHTVFAQEITAAGYRC